MCGENDKKPADSKDGKDKCYRCGQFGHKKIDCTKDGSKSGVGRYTSKPSSRVNLLSSQPGKPCPVCKTHHSKTNIYMIETLIKTRYNNSGDTVYMSRLTSCSAWMNLSLADRAKAVETANGCSLCTDWTGDHQKDKCDAKKKGGIPYEACKIEDNSGRTCGSQHNHLLHGSSVQFCNLVRGIKRRGAASGEGCSIEIRSEVTPQSLEKLTGERSVFSSTRSNKDLLIETLGNDTNRDEARLQWRSSGSVFVFWNGLPSVWLARQRGGGQR